LERRIAQGEAAFQRPVIRRKIEDLLRYYRECQEAGNLPAIPGAVIIIAERGLRFTPSGTNPNLGLLQIPEEPGILRALDGQHRLLALHAAAKELGGLEVPAVLFDNLDDRQVVELFVTINAKHTRLNPSHLISLAGRRLYADENQALAHDIIRALNETESSPLRGEIRILSS
jgi:DGQHR domain-containing protein